MTGPPEGRSPGGDGGPSAIPFYWEPPELVEL